MIEVSVDLSDSRNELHSSPIAKFRDASSCYFTKSEGDRYLHKLHLHPPCSFHGALHFHFAVIEGQKEDQTHLAAR